VSRKVTGRVRITRDQRVRRTSAKDDSGNTSNIARTTALLDSAAHLADELATIAARTGRAQYAAATVHLCASVHFAHLAAEALCEGALT
jgi:hypothetical protein